MTGFPSTLPLATLIRVTDTQLAWPRDLVAAVGREVKRLTRRDGQRPLTAQQLSDLMTQLGTPMTRTTVSDLLNERRGAHLTVPELVSLGRILDVPPALLAFPGYPDAPIVVGEDVWATSENLVRWASGREVGPGMPRATAKDGTKLYFEQSGKWRRLVEAVEERAQLDTTLVELVDSFADLVELDSLTAQQRLVIAGLAQAAEESRNKLRELNARIQTLGGVVEESDGARSAGD